LGGFYVLKRWYAAALDGLKAALVLLAIAGVIAFIIDRRDMLSRVDGLATAIDGDSLRLDSREVRLEGIDAPEYRQTCQLGAATIACGRTARDALAALLAKGPIRCVDHGRDRFGRMLGICFSGDIDINAAMVAGGNAIAVGRYEAEEANARRASRGIWASSFELPADYRARTASHPAR
jgi:endonuclease YncB( thermonuclease family)